MQKNTAGNLSSLDKIFGAFVTQTVEDYVDGSVKIKALAVLENKVGEETPFMILPIYEPFDIDKNQNMTANRVHINSISRMSVNTGKKLVMFMTAFDGISESPQYGIRDTLMVAARRSDGASITKVYLKDVPGKDGILTENASHEGVDWKVLTKTSSVEDTIAKYLMDSIWKEYAIGLSTEKAVSGRARIINAV